MNIPADRQIIDGEIASYWFDDGVLVSLSNSTKRTIANIKANVALVKQITGKKKVPLLIYLKNSPVPDKDTRKFAAEQVSEIYSAMAMVSKPGLAAFIMKLLFKIKPPPIPMKHFTDDKAAMQWLRQFV